MKNKRVELLAAVVAAMMFSTLWDTTTAPTPSTGDYVGGRAMISFDFILTNPHLWVRVEEPFHIIS